MNTITSIQTDLALEILCSLSPHPVPVAKLAQDFGLENGAVRTRLKELAGRGFAVATGRYASAFPEGSVPADAADRQGIHAWVERPGWFEAERAAQTYWGSVYGG